ncbi:MAG: T9SS type A sorting domain-containing protein, partial [Spirochaetes bacterium]|nr:T9SS type A sorting domain-containing protein [Spirochaetota bacterium]
DSKNNLFYGCHDNTFFGGSIYKSSDHGNNWKEVEKEEGSSMFEASDGNLYYGIGWAMPGVNFQKSYDIGESWANLSVAAKGFFAIFEDSNNALYVSSHNPRFIPPVYTTNRFYKSTDYGTNWIMIYKHGAQGFSGTCVFHWIFELISGEFIAGQEGFGSVASGIYISSNYGTNWSIISDTSNFNYYSTVFRSGDNSIYAGGDSGIARSADEGATWQQVSSITCMRLIEANDGVFYKTSHSNVWKSFDKGTTWHKTPSLIKENTNFCNFSPRRRWPVFQDDTGRIYAGGAVDKEQGYLFINQYAVSNSVLLSFHPQGVVKYSSFEKSEILNGGSIIYQFMYSLDNGATWSAWADLTDVNLQNVPCKTLGEDKLKIRITLYSLNRYATPEVDRIKIIYDDGSRDNLDDIVVAPNPYESGGNNYVTFYNLPLQVKMKVYSMGGGCIAEIDNIYSTVGRYKWDMKNREGEAIKSGVYICRLEDTKGNKRSLKLVIIR